ncbi:MAG TPA: amino acid adenylation domain-containing protein [Candidatus Acidoferrum sp.]|nr:amino acid adenylation domain-containing protein [Candidatus Acidoferrum sp.]
MLAREDYAVIPRRKQSGPAVLSFAQERLWFLDLYYPNSPIYNIPAPIPFTGVLDPEVSCTVLNEIVRRHESLRTTFQMGPNGTPTQDVSAGLVLQLPVIDVRSLPEQQKQTELARIFNEERNRIFSLENGPLLHAALIRIKDDFQYLFLNVHHIVSDAWSMSVFMNEFRTLYESFSLSRPSPLPALPIQYADFSVWQREWLTGKVLDEQLAYWSRQLSTADSTVLELPSDRPRPPFLTFKGATISFVLPHGVSERLRRFATSSGSTPFMILLAGFKILLYRYTGQSSLIVGFPAANRTRSELENLIGFFVNSLPLHTRISGNTTFHQMVQQVRATVLGALAHQDLPFEKLVAELAPERNVNANPIFQVMFDFQHSAIPQSAQPQVEVSEQLQETQSAMIHGTSKFDLSLSMGNSGRQFCGTLEFSTDMFDEATIRRFIQCFHMVLSDATENPDRPIKLLEVVPASERQRVLLGSNSTDTRFSLDKCIHAMFEAQVERTPDLIAARFHDQSLTYRELNRRANRLARYLQSRSIGPESIVGICMEGCLELIIAVLGVLKAGGAYLPIDPAYPRDRIGFMIEDAKTELLLVHSSTADSVSGMAKGAEVMIDTIMPLLDQTDASNVHSDACSSNACYVIYTSGSTGRPKGVVVEHRGVANLVQAFVQLFSIGVGSRILQFSSFSFDVSVREIFEPLLSGATICLARRDELTPGEPLIRAFQEYGITTVTLAPSVWAHLPHADLPALTCAIAGGEACSAAVVDRWSRGRNFFNAYGPTEVTVGSSVAQCFPGGKPSIGTPLPNLKFYVVDSQLQLCIPGTPGELLIGGIGVSRGYLRRPGLTAERFIPDAFGSTPGGRLYRTGDLVRQLQDGSIDYLGRIDTQVKIRGFRIELGEVESVLAEHPAVAACTIGVHEKAEYDRHLVAYVVLRESEIRPEVLKQFVASRLPRYMVPQAYIFLDRIPLTPAGKVDVRALPTPEQAQRRESYVAAKTETEKFLERLWSEVLQVERVGIHDNFFEMGGHSLLVMQVISRLRERLGRDTPLRVLFESPTIAELAAYLDGGGVGDSGTSGQPADDSVRQAAAPRLERAQGSPSGIPRDLSRTDTLGPRDGPSASADSAVMSFAQERLWFLQQFEPGNTAYNVVAPLPLRGPVSIPALTRAFNEVVRRHEILRTVFRTEKGLPVQVICRKTNTRLEVVDLRDRSRTHAQEELKKRTQAEASTPFDLARGPLLRAILFQIADDDSLLFLCMHHIICDAWSFGVLSNDLQTIYRSFSLGEPTSLLPPERQYREFATWQRDTLQEQVLAQHLSYYRKQLEGTPPFLNLPYRQSNPLLQSAAGRAETFSVPADVCSRLKALAHAEGVSMFMLLLATFNVLLYRYTGEEHIVVGTPMANRPRREFEHTVGLFTNTLVLHTDLSGDPSFRDVLRRVREMTLEAYSHQDLPFERLVSELNPERNLNATPLFQVMFIFQEGSLVFREPESPVGLESVFEGGAAKFDLTFYLEQSGSGIRGAVEYKTALFDSSVIRGMILHFLRILETTAHNPELSIVSLPLVDSGEQQALLKPSVVPPVPEGISGVHQMVEIQARQTPHAVALRTSDDSLTYAQMNDKANRLARLLQKAGAGPERVVAVYLERGIDPILVLLAILKAGGIYLPIETTVPASRIELVLRQAGAVAVVTTTQLAARLPGSDPYRICLDEVQEELAALGCDDLAVPGSQWNGCYLIYTSGSTGRPKAVLLPKRTLLQLICWQMQRGGGDGFAATTLQYSSLGFDVSLQEVFTTLCSGGTLVCVSPDQRKDIWELFALMIQSHVQRVFMPYATLKQWSDFVATARLSALPKLKEIIVAGEQLRITPSIAGLVAQMDHCALINQYGPSESHVVSEYRLSNDTGEWPPTPPIGSAVAGATLYVLDENAQLVPPGVVGELFIGGDALARGYMQSPSQTAEKFVPDPFAKDSGRRMYRTGDMVRYNSQGELEFLHRIDDQIKVRGFRVELGEVEFYVSLVPEVIQAAVTYISSPSNPSTSRLVAYVVRKENASLTATDLITRLRSQLPEYMVPNEIVWLESLPLTTTGKVDKKRLPAPEGIRRGEERPFVAPRSPLEQELATIWTSLLGVDNPGVEDDFFENGGQSILATQLAAALAERYSVEVGLRKIFEQPTIAALAVAVVQAQALACSDATVKQLLTELK